MENLKEKMNDYPNASDIVIGDEIIFKESVFGGSFRNPSYKGDRYNHVIITKESYGGERGQHTFSFEVLNSEGIEPLSKGTKTRRKGRNIYGEAVLVKSTADREKLQEEKHTRGQEAKESKYWGWLQEAEFEDKKFKIEKIPYSFLQKNKETIIENYPIISANIFPHYKGGKISSTKKFFNKFFNK